MYNRVMRGKNTGSNIKRMEVETLFSGPFRYSIVSTSTAVPEASCILDIVRYANGVCGVMMTEEKHNRGPSVTNACDRIATQAYHARLSDTQAEKIVWLEHCPASRNYKGHIDLLQFRLETPRNENNIASRPDNDGFVFTSPRWQRFFESPRISSPLAFLRDYSFVLKELCTASMIFSVKDKKGYNWRVWANGSGFFIISANPSAVLGKEMLGINGVTAALKENSRLMDVPEIGQRFTNALMKGFLNDEI